MKNICVFCGASNAIPKKFRDLAVKCGEMLAKYNYELIYGGGSSGMMGDVSHASHEAGGKVTGIYPNTVHLIEPLSAELDNQLLVDDLFERKKLMLLKSDAFLIIPGGYGTLDELFEVITLKLLNDHNKPIIILNYEGFWDTLLKLMNEIDSQNFTRRKHSEVVDVCTTLEEVFELLGNMQNPNDTTVRARL